MSKVEVLTASPEILVLGPSFLDVVCAPVARLPMPGEELFTPSIAFCPGGSAIAAAALSRLGIRSALGSPIGNDTSGDLIRTALRRDGVILPSPVASSTPVTVALNYSADRAFLTAGWPPDTALQEAALAVLQRWPEAPAVHLSGRGAWSLAVARRVKSEGRYLSLDCGTAPDWLGGTTFAAILKEVDVYLPNAREAMAVTGESDVESAARALSRTVPLAVVKLGPEGALLAADGELSHHPTRGLEPYDATGAGDVFDAGFLAAMRLGFPLPAAVELANYAAGCAIAMAGGATFAPTRRSAQAALPHLPWPSEGGRLNEDA